VQHVLDEEASKKRYSAMCGTASARGPEGLQRSIEDGGGGLRAGTGTQVGASTSLQAGRGFVLPRAERQVRSVCPGPFGPGDVSELRFVGGLSPWP
jgi:hypothetical protein